MYQLFLQSKYLRSSTLICASLALGVSNIAFAQLPSLPGQDVQNAPAVQDEALPEASDAQIGDSFEFDTSGDLMGFEATAEERREQARQEAFDAAIEGLLPLRPNEIRSMLERFDRTQESVETPIYPNPKPEVVVQNISLDPGAEPVVIKLAYGHVTTVNFMDITGAPWPVQDLSWAGNFEVIESGGSEEGDQSVFRISPQSEFAFGNMSITLNRLRTPIIVTLETNRDVVHYRFDARVTDYGPYANPPLIESGITTTAGSVELSSILEGIAPQSAERLDVAGVDGRTTAYRQNDVVYLRTPLTLLSPAWSSSTTSADGTNVYEISNASVVLLSDKGRMVRAKLSDRSDILEGALDE